MRQLPAFNGEYRHPNKRILNPSLNRYCENNVCYIYLQRLDAHLRNHGYIPCNLHPLFYFKNLPTDCPVIGATVDNLIVTAPTETHIDSFERILSVKYRVIDLGPPTEFFDCTVHHQGTGPIQLSQRVLISKSLDKYGLIYSNPRSKPLPKNHDFA